MKNLERRESVEGRNRLAKRKQIMGADTYLIKWTSRCECIHATQVFDGRKTETFLHSRGRLLTDQIEEIELKKHI